MRLDLIWYLLCLSLLVKKRGGGYRGFKSQKQWRWAFATKQPWARKKARETAGGPKVRFRRLPKSKHSGRKGSRLIAGRKGSRLIAGRKKSK